MKSKDKNRLIEFKPKAPDRCGDFPATIKPRDYSRRCEHRRSVVDEEARTVECQDCGAPLDPLSVLAQLAHGWDRERWKIEWGHKLDHWIAEWHAAGGRIAIRPSGVTVEMHGRRWSSRCSGGALAQLESALETGRARNK